MRHAGIHHADRAVDVPAGGGAVHVAEQTVGDRIDVHLLRADIGKAINQIRPGPERVEGRTGRQREDGIYNRRRQLPRAESNVGNRAGFLARVGKRMTKAGCRNLLRTAVEYRPRDRRRPVIAEALGKFAEDIDLRGR